MTEIPSIKKLEKILNRFVVQDICDIVLQSFPEITWEEIQAQAVQHNTKSISKKNIIKIISNAADDLSDEEIEARTSKLLLYYIGKTESKTWNAFRLKNKIEGFNEQADKLDSIKSCVRRAELFADINLLKFNGKFIISAVNKKIRPGRGMSKSPPIYLQLFAYQPYIFISNGKVDGDLITAIINGLGYNKYEYCHLYGPNVRDLLTLLRNKDGGVSSAKLIECEPNLEPEIQINDNVKIYSQYAKRTKYAEQIYGKNPPRLQCISVAVKNDTWNSTGLDAMEGTSIDGMELTIQSPNVIELLKESIAKGIISMPIPPYIENILSAGRNSFKINPSK